MDDRAGAREGEVPRSNEQPATDTGGRATPDRAVGDGPRPWPRVAASTAVFRGSDVLLVERGKASSRGLWSLPGGHIEAGETASAAAEREVLEETGVAIDMGGVVGVHDVIVRDSEGRLTAHYVLAVHWAHWRSGEPNAATDVIGARFVPLSAIGELPTTAGLEGIVRAAAAHRERGSPRPAGTRCEGRYRVVSRAVLRHRRRGVSVPAEPR